MRRSTPQIGFTLIELSIVLVIIGLLVGGILVGQDLIKSAEVRAQISQIDKYNSAVNTFESKFDAIPGDMSPAIASLNNFPVGAGCAGGGVTGHRDGNRLIDGISGNPSPPYLNQGFGETGLFWQDLSSSIAGSLIEGQFPNSGAAAITCNNPSSAFTTTPGPAYIGDIIPAAKIGHGNFVYVYNQIGYNWYGLSAVTSISTAGNLISSATVPVAQAYAIDKKIDDGLPTTGAVQAAYINASGSTLAYPPNAPTDSPVTCYNTTSNAYSVSSLANYGAGGNCALSFQFQ